MGEVLRAYIANDQPHAHSQRFAATLKLLQGLNKM